MSLPGRDRLFNGNDLDSGLFVGVLVGAYIDGGVEVFREDVAQPEFVVLDDLLHVHGVARVERGLLGLGRLGGKRGVGEGKRGWRLVGEIYGLLHGFSIVSGNFVIWVIVILVFIFVCFGNYFLLCCSVNQYFFGAYSLFASWVCLKIMRKLK